ncbi:MAG: 30S ribosomal protein S5 [Candidatus Algichlamydia australiensis]|nr:30S ribosomal protein S5 [Chlamydiales bacterium]
MAKKQKREKEIQESDLQEKVLFINRCSKVVKGGRKFSFSALVLVGDGNGRIGLGFAKANEVADCIKKAGQAARKEMVTFEMDGTTIPHEIRVQWDGAVVMLKPAKPGTGIIAGSKTRSVLEVGGLKDVIAKSLGSNNPINLARATVKGLLQLKNKEQILAARGKTS